MNATNEQSAKLRFGYVSEYDENRHMARVEFPDSGIISHWLPILVTNALMTQYYHPLGKGEHVACMMAGTGSETGIILGSFYDDTNDPDTKDKNICYVKFADGTELSYDWSRHELSIDSVGSLYISGSNVDISGGTVKISGAVDCPGYCRCS